MSDIAFAPASKLLQLLDRRELSSRELLELYLARIDKFNGQLNAVVYLDVEKARASADLADEAGSFLFLVVVQSDQVG